MFQLEFGLINRICRKLITITIDMISIIEAGERMAAL